jgi:hypothetical protein
MSYRLVRLLALPFLAAAGPVAAQQVGAPGKLLLTNGISSVEGSAGGGLTPWAVIAGNETRDGVGAQAAVTAVALPDYDLANYSIAIGLRDRLELSYARQSFDTNKVGGALGLGNDFTFDQDIWGAKVRLAGDAVFGPSWLPAVAIGVQYKKNLDPAIVRAVGARERSGADLYVTTTKLLLDHSLLVNATVRATKANQLGLLGFGGPVRNGRRAEAEGSVAYQFSRRFVAGAEYRMKTGHLAFAREDDAWDAFAAYAIGRHLTATVAYADLGSIATVAGQRGLLVQLQGGF